MMKNSPKSEEVIMEASVQLTWNDPLHFISIIFYVNKKIFGK